MTSAAHGPGSDMGPVPGHDTGPVPGSATGPGPRYDAGRVAAAARRADPGLPPESAELLARQAGTLLGEAGGLDAPALARRLLLDNRDLGATAVNVVAVAAVDAAAGHPTV